MSKNALCMWDFVYDLSGEILSYTSVLKNLKGFVKKLSFQLEEGSSGYRHFQGRLSLIKKRRKSEIIKLFKAQDRIMPRYFKPTSNPTFYTGNNFYVMKEETRIEGPWTEKEYQSEEIYIPRQVREMKTLRPFQTQIIENAKVWDTRTINVVYNESGNIGKSRLVSYCRAHKIGRALPSVNDYKDLLRMVYCLPTSKLYLFDMPRALKKDKQFQLYSAIETIKDGYAYDDRYTFKEKVFDCPNIWIFTNTLPDKKLLSKDRWKIWQVCDDYSLELFDDIEPSSQCVTFD